MNASKHTDAISRLADIRENAGSKQTIGISIEQVSDLLNVEPDLEKAITLAHQRFQGLSAAEKDLMRLDEADLIQHLQSSFLNFYPEEAINPYVPLAAKGPWVVSTHGAVILDCGGYGMLGAGHAPDHIINSMTKPYVMANIMTASLSQKRFIARLKKNLGFKRGHCPFDRFLCLNSGSESVTVASRISDANAKDQTFSDGPHAGKKTMFMALKGAFHGRTDRPAQVSDSSLPRYKQHLLSFQNRKNLILVEPNNIPALREAFANANQQGIFVEALFMEPIQGEGNPGVSIERSFYDVARELTLENDSMLIVDSIQAGIRGQGCLSIVDYPGFEDCDVPDMETWSKALNGGQYPLSVLGLSKRAAASYKRGLYGNTMTTNPRALEVACAVLDDLTPSLQANIVSQGKRFLNELNVICEEYPNIALHAQGTGLLFAIELYDKYSVTVKGGVEEQCRKRGLGIIHGGKNAIRFTPVFATTDAQVNLTLTILRDVFDQLS